MNKMPLVMGIVLCCGLFALEIHAAEKTDRFQPNWESLKQYECPDWFRNAKFGIWAHWSAQCVPEQGDWYARNMYRQGEPQYMYHVGHYGHPSKVGFKDICNLWKAEKWDPEKLINLYKRAGAKYFVALANHHCNFDCWNSKHHAWNSVNIGPKKDIVGEWAKAARKEGLRFGVTVHSARSWTWYEVAQGSDGEGPLKSIPYDGILTRADGKGQWWDGYDPQELYAQNHKSGDPPDQAYIDNFYSRVVDLIDSYRPDLLYFDDRILPLEKYGDAGLRIAAHYYNASMDWHNGKLEAVLNTKSVPDALRKAVVWDIERGRTNRKESYPWQTDTCIGDWHYKSDIAYRMPADVITTLVDIVSKNGNLLLNIPVRGDGTIDDREIRFLQEMAKWMDVNGEAIFDSKPWILFGEGPTCVGTGGFGERNAKPYTPQDIRFTVKGENLFAFALGWPADGKVVIQSLAKPTGFSGNRISAVNLLGHRRELKWTQDQKGLTIVLPAQKPCDHAYAFKVTGKDLAPAP